MSLVPWLPPVDAGTLVHCMEWSWFLVCLSQMTGCCTWLHDVALVLMMLQDLMNNLMNNLMNTLMDALMNDSLGQL